MCKSLDAVGAWHLLEMGSRWQWGTAEDLGQVSNMMRFSRETTLVAVRRVDLNSKSETGRTVQRLIIMKKGTIWRRRRRSEALWNQPGEEEK